VRSSNRSEHLYYLTWIFVVSESALLILPVILLVVFSFLTPSYMAPMFHDPLGIALLAAAARVLAAGGAATMLGLRMLRTGRPGLTIALLLGSTILCATPALWLVLLGPAIVMVSKT
jgi:heme/copper-type cytochrome/quinol oxidase subunit 3